MERQLAKVSSATLNIKDRGILHFWVMVDYEEGCSQGVGGITLDMWDEESQSRIGTAYGCEMIRQVLTVFDVNDFSEMRGKYIWVLGEGKGLMFTPKGFESLHVDGKKRTMLFDEVYNKFKEELKDE